MLRQVRDNLRKRRLVLLTLVTLLALAALYLLNTPESDTRLVGALAQYSPENNSGNGNAVTGNSGAAGTRGAAPTDNPDELAVVLDGAVRVPGPGTIGRCQARLT